MDFAIELHDVGKQYRRYSAARPQTLRDAVLRWRSWFQPAETFWSLRHVTHDVPAGCTLGIIGRNGAGKSTLLNILGGVTLPDEGRVRVRGKINAILDLGAGFHPDLTGRENVFVTGVIAGLSRREVAARFDKIVAFAGLEEFIDSPLRTYSDGMRMRLAFSIATHTDPDVLLVDEVLAVGDAAFQERCLARIREIKRRGCTIVVVSHAFDMVRELCDQVLHLQHGKLISAGPPELVVEEYLRSLDEEIRLQREGSGVQFVHQAGLVLGDNRFGTLVAEITKVRIASQGAETDQIAAGAPLEVEIDYVAHEPNLPAIFGVSICDDKGQIVLDLTTNQAGSAIQLQPTSGSVGLTIDRLDLAGGEYYVNVGIYGPDFQPTYDYHWRYYYVAVNSAETGHGHLCPPHRWLVPCAKS